MGARRASGRRLDRRGRGPPQPRQLDRLRHASTGPSLGVPDDGCAGVPDDQRYDAETNPGGVRCTLADYMINVFGPRPRARGAAGAAVGHGFAGLPLDNVGVQFGLEALEEGPDHAGPVRRPEREDRRRRHRHQADARAHSRPTSPRCAAPTAAAGSTRRTTSTRSRSSTCAGPTRARSTTPTARGRSARGSSASTATSRNHVIWFGPGAADRRPELRDRGAARDGPLAGRRRGGRQRTSRCAQKIVADRPADIQDRCSQIAGVEQVACRASAGLRARAGPDPLRHAGTVAGESIATDTNKCQLKPLRRARLLPDRRSPTRSGRSSQTAFPTGVCDWSQPGRRASRTRSRGRPTRTPTAR